MSARRCVDAVAAVLAISLVLGPASRDLRSAEQPPKPAADFYVAPDGRDTNPGTRELPFATLTRARDAVRQGIAAGLKGDVLIEVRGGVYPQTETLRFGPEDSGGPQHAVVYAAAPGEKVVLSGGRKITGWKRDDGPIWTAKVPEAKAGRWCFRQLFVDGRRAVRARSPNAGDGRPYWAIRSASVQGGAADLNKATYVVSVDHPIRAWKNIGDVEFAWINNNDGSRRRLGGVDVAAQTFTLPPPHQWPPKFLPGEYQIGYPAAGNGCYFENAREMLDEPGEWYLDRHSGVVSYWPRPGEDLLKAQVVAPVVQKTLLAVEGTPDRPVRNLHFRGIGVAHVDWPLPPFGYTAMFGCLQIASGEKPQPFAKFHWIDPAVRFEYARRCSFRDAAVEHCGGIGVGLLRGTAEIAIEGNEIAGLGGGGIVAGGLRNRDTLRWADPIAKDDHQGYRIAGNHVHDCGLDYAGAIGVFVALARDSVVAHNLIHDISYSGVVLSGNEDKSLPLAGDNTVEANHIHHVMKTAVDGAGIYVSFPQSDSGAAVRGNLIHDLRPNPLNGRAPGPYSSPAIYLDAVRPEYGCRGYRFEKNTVYNTETPLFFCQCGREGNTWIDNVLDSAGPLHNCRLQFERQKKGHVAFIGGSITEMNGYRPLVCEILKRRFPKTTFTFTDAGVSSTCSTAGAMRLKSDVLSKGPVDLFFIEFAVNDDQDAHHARRECVRGMEGILRQCLRHNPRMDIVITYFVNPEMLQTLRSGGTPLTIEAHEAVARHYGIPTINLAKEVADQISEGKLTWEKFGGTHPAPFGNALCARMIDKLMERAWAKPQAVDAAPVAHPLPEPLDPLCYANGRFIDPKQAVVRSGWTLGVPDWKSLKGSTRDRFDRIAMLHADRPGAELTLEFTGTAVGAYVVAGPDAGTFEARIDGGPPREVNLYHQFSAGLHYPRTVMFATDLKPGRHVLALRVGEKTSSKGHAARIMQFVGN